VLAIPLVSSDRLDQKTSHLDGHSASQATKEPSANGGVILGPPSSQRGGAQTRQPHPVLRKIVRDISVKIGRYKKQDDKAHLVDGMIEAMRIIDRAIKGGA